VDAAFSKKHCRFPIKSGKRKVGEIAVQTITQRQATSLRQSAEWGMRGDEGSFPRLKDKLLFSQRMEDRKVFLYLIPMLLNFQTHRIGLNKLQSTFYPIFNDYKDHVLDRLL